MAVLKPEPVLLYVHGQCIATSWMLSLKYSEISM
jgi:hypothetical protein